LSARSPRWSKKIDTLVRTVAPDVRPALQSELGHWMAESSRFADFVTANQNKIRKKLSTTDEEARQDVRAELLVARALLADRRFELAFEAYGSGQTGPDFTATFRANQQFNIEVTRLRGEGESDPAAEVSKLANVIAGKLRQLPADRPNGLLIASLGRTLGGAPVDAALRALKSRAEARDDEFFARRGLKTARDFHARSLLLGGIFVLDANDALFVANPEARRALPTDVVAATLAALRATP
jgi:hypothetical protein